MSNEIIEKDYLILVVDDDDGNRHSVKRVLENEGYRIIEADNGKQAIELAEVHKPDLVVSDVGLPDMSGFEVGKRIKAMSKSLIVPILHISASFVGTAAKVKGLDSGADGYLSHPIEPVIVVSTVRSLLRIRKGERERFDLLENMKRNQVELQIAKQAADDANHAKSRFLANMSHEIRTPLGAILGCADLLSDPMTQAEDRLEFLNIIRRSGHQLASVIDDILDLSKIEAGHLEIERMTVSMSALITDMNSFFASRAKQKNITFQIEVNENVPASIVSDPTRLRQILINIIGNAIKFTNSGGVTLKIEASRSNTETIVKFNVIDSGPGIAEELWGRLFEPFTQADISMTRKFGGTGLGLNLARRLAKALGGDVNVEKSQIGIGTTFAVTVRTETVSGIHTVNSLSELALLEKEVGVRPRLDGMRVLLIEDAIENRIIINKVLQNAGAHVDTADNGAEGVMKALSTPHDVILMDIQMPVKDGMQATRELRQHGYKSPIVALTAHAMQEERNRCLEEGFDAHIPKPIDFNQLIRFLGQYREH